MSLEARFRFESPVSSGPFPQFVIVPCRLPAFPIFICACARLMIASFLSPLRAVARDGDDTIVRVWQGLVDGDVRTGLVADATDAATSLTNDGTSQLKHNKHYIS